MPSHNTSTPKLYFDIRTIKYNLPSFVNKWYTMYYNCSIRESFHKLKREYVEQEI